MKSKLQNRANLEPESGLTPAFRNTDSFAMIPDHYWNNRWYLKPNHHIIFNYLIYQAKWAKGGHSVGKISIGTYELSEKLNIPQKTVHRILKFLESQGEISLTPTSKFTIVTVKHLLKNDLQNEKNDLQNNVVINDTSITYNNNKKEMTYKTEKITYKTKKMTTPIDIDNIDKNINENSIFVEEEKEMNLRIRPKLKELEEEISVEANSANKVVQVPVNDTALRVTKTNKIVKQVDTIEGKEYIQTLLDIWAEEYHLAKDIKYVVSQTKDMGGIEALFNLLKTDHPSLDSQGMIDYFRNFCKQVFAIKDPFIYENCNPAFINLYINKVRLKLLDPNQKKSYSSIGQAQAGEDYYLPL